MPKCGTLDEIDTQGNNKEGNKKEGNKKEGNKKEGNNKRRETIRYRPRSPQSTKAWLLHPTPQI
jgi:hypothetical protein